MFKKKSYKFNKHVKNDIKISFATNTSDKLFITTATKKATSISYFTTVR